MAAFDAVPGASRTDLRELLRAWTAAAARLTSGRLVGETGDPPVPCPCATAIERWPDRGAPGIRLRPVEAVEGIQRNAAPLQDAERGAGNLSGVHDDCGAELHLADLAQPYGFSETRQQQRWRVGPAKITGAHSGNCEKEQNGGQDDPDC